MKWVKEKTLEERKETAVVREEQTLVKSSPQLYATHR
jgi:hypothetical protein